MESKKTYNVLFLCTGNSARSILAEAAVSRWGAGRFRGFSAGSQPKGTVHPLTLKLLSNLNYDIRGFRSKSWDEFAGPEAPPMNFVFTVCDNAAGETCPIWPGRPMTAHWGIEDPAAVEGPEFRQRAAFDDAYRFMKNRIEAFISLPLASIDQMTLAARLKGIGGMSGSTLRAPQVA